MAEGIARSLLEVETATFESAGTAGLEGSPASENAVEACREVGVDLSGHRARRLTPTMAAAYDRIYVMTEDHLAEVMAIAPFAAVRADLLDPAGREIGDPYGDTLGVYRAARDEITAAIRERVEEWG
jgi:protein-tyrosine-phosphatase